MTYFAGFCLNKLVTFVNIDSLFASMLCTCPNGNANTCFILHDYSHVQGRATTLPMTYFIIDGVAKWSREVMRLVASVHLSVRSSVMPSIRLSIRQRKEQQPPLPV